MSVGLRQGSGELTTESQVRNFTILKTSGIWNCNFLVVEGGWHVCRPRKPRRRPPRRKRRRSSRNERGGVVAPPLISPPWSSSARRSSHRTSATKPGCASLAHSSQPLNNVIVSQVSVIKRQFNLSRLLGLFLGMGPLPETAQAISSYPTRMPSQACSMATPILPATAGSVPSSRDPTDG